MSNVIAGTIETVGSVQTVVDIVGGCYKAFRIKRLENFAKDCEKLFFEGKPFNEQEFRDFFQDEFAQEHIHQFFHSILETHSRVSQLAIAKLFTSAVARKAKYLTLNESVILRALQGLEDIDIEVLFMCFFVGQKGKIEGKDINCFNSIENSFYFLFGEADFEKNKQKFSSLGIRSIIQLRSLIQRFFYSKIFAESIHVIVDDHSDIWFSEGDNTAKEFMELLEWARNIENK